MKVSLSIIKSLIDFDLPDISQVISRINQRLGGVEDMVNLGAKYEGAAIVKVVDCQKHPNADKLSVCKIDAGTGELIQVVCGAPNVRSGMWAIWLPPKSVVPSTFKEADPFVLGSRELRGILSNGMLASEQELAISSNHEGIVEISEKDLPEGVVLEAGAGFAETFGLNDYVIEIENKMFTHRPDLFGQIGVAREIAGIYHQKFTSPDWYGLGGLQLSGRGLELEVYNENYDRVPRFMATAMTGIEVGDSPLWLKCRLVGLGAKPINNVVDITNYIMLMSAQPVHAYDYDKLHGGKIGARMARAGEKIELINGKTYELDENDIVIADGEGPVGLAGVMGGAATEVSSATKNIVIEVATFDMYTIRRTSMRHGLFTDAVTRFNKGQSPWQNDIVLAELVKLMSEVCAGELASEISDLFSPDYRQLSGRKTNSFSINKINELLGLNLDKSQIQSLLGNVDLEFNDSDQTLSLPFWRMDLAGQEDVAEEVGRLYGYDQLPRQLPLRRSRPAPKNPTRETKQRVRESLVSSGANEVLTYSFVNGDIIRRANQDVSQAFRLSNALSPDLQFYRLTILPSLLDKVHANIKSGHEEFVLSEIGKGHNKERHLNDDNGLPGESAFVDMVYTSKRELSGAPYYRARQIVDQLMSDLGIRAVYRPADLGMSYQVSAPFDLSRSALVETVEGRLIGMVGELRQEVLSAFKLPIHTSAATLDLRGLEDIHSSRTTGYRPLSRFPATSRDISLRTSSDVSYQSLYDSVKVGVKNSKVDVSVDPVSIYQSDDGRQTKTTTFRITFVSHQKTLSDKDVAPLMESISDSAASACGAQTV